MSSLLLLSFYLFPSFISLTAFLRCNSHTIQFTHLKYAIQLFSVCSQKLCNHHHNQFSNISSPQIETPYPLIVILCFPLALHCRQPLIYFLSLWICLLRIFHINKIIWSDCCLLSLNVVFSKFISVVACITSIWFSIMKGKASFLFIVK